MFLRGDSLKKNVCFVFLPPPPLPSDTWAFPRDLSPLCIDLLKEWSAHALYQAFNLVPFLLIRTVPRFFLLMLNRRFVVGVRFRLKSHRLYPHEYLPPPFLVHVLFPGFPNAFGTFLSILFLTGVLFLGSLLTFPPTRKPERTSAVRLFFDSKGHWPPYLALPP